MWHEYSRERERLRGLLAAASGKGAGRAVAGVVVVVPEDVLVVDDFSAGALVEPTNLTCARTWGLGNDTRPSGDGDGGVEESANCWREPGKTQ